MGENLPPVAQLVPQQQPMMLLERICDCGEDFIECAVTAGRAKAPQLEEGRIAVWTGLEYMAQTLAAFAGVHAFRAGTDVRKGVVLGSRKMQCMVSSFEEGQQLLIRAEPLSDNGEVGVFHCEIRDAQSSRLLMCGTLSVYKPEDFAVLLQGRGQ